MSCVSNGVVKNHGHWPVDFSYRTLSESGKSRSRTTSTRMQLEEWSRDWQTHEQFIMGQSTGRSAAKMKAFLDDVETKIKGNQSTKEHGKQTKSMKGRKKAVIK